MLPCKVGIRSYLSLRFEDWVLEETWGVLGYADFESRSGERSGYHERDNLVLEPFLLIM